MSMPYGGFRLNSLNLLQVCQTDGCKENLEFSTTRQFCSKCAEIRKKNQYKNHKRKVKTRDYYQKMFVNLTKNYILFVEGVQK